VKKSDFQAVTVIGIAVGLLSQPIMANLVAEPTFVLRLSVFLGFVVLAPLALFIAFLLGKFISVLYQFAKFAAVGVLNTFVDLGVLNLEIFLSGQASGWAYSLFKAISFLFSTTNSFFWNKYWTFGSKGAATSSEAAKFYSVAAVGWAVNVGLASLVVNGVGRPDIISPNLWANIGAMAGVAGAMFWDFVGYKYLVFKKSGDQDLSR